MGGGLRQGIDLLRNEVKISATKYRVRAPAARSKQQARGYVITANFYERVLLLESGDNQGTAFTVEYEGDQYLITARHCVPDTDGPIPLTVSHRGQRTECTLARLPGMEAGVDISVFRCANRLTATDALPVEMGAASVYYTQDAYYVGYPLGMSLVMGEREVFGLVKRGIVSGSTDLGGIKMWYIDSVVNPGFSGGPVVFRDLSSIEQKYKILGVVTAYRTEDIPARNLDGSTSPYRIAANSGIALATDIKYAEALIRRSR